MCGGVCGAVCGAICGGVCGGICGGWLIIKWDTEWSKNWSRFLLNRTKVGMLNLLETFEHFYKQNIFLLLILKMEQMPPEFEGARICYYERNTKIGQKVFNPWFALPYTLTALILMQ